MSIPAAAKGNISAKWVVDSLLDISKQEDPLSEIQSMVEALLSGNKTKTLSATDATVVDLQMLFNIDFNMAEMALNPWKLQDEPFEMPKRLRQNLEDVSKTFCDEDSEAASRIAVDMMLVACRIHIMNQYPTRFSSKKQKTASGPATPYDCNIRETVRIYPEMELRIEVDSPKTKEKVRVSGRADWCFGYSRRDGAAYGTFFVAAEAKRLALFETAKTQLLTYLAIIRHLRIRAGKKSVAAQGFYTDGFRYRFMAITDEGKVTSSRVYEVLNPEDGKTIFNFIVTVLDAAVKSSPTVLPVKDATQEERETNNFTGAIWEKVYVPYHSSSRTDCGDSEEDTWE